MQLGFQKIGGVDKAIEHEWRLLHTHIIGRPGMGAEETVQRFAIEDINAGAGVAFFDFSTEGAHNLMRHIPPERWDDVCLLSPTDRKFPIGMNILHNVKREDQPRVVDMVLDTFHALYPSKIFTANVDKYILATTAALLQCPEETLLGIYYMLDSATYRGRVLSHCKDPVVEQFWQSFEAIPAKERRQNIESTLSRIFSLILDPTIRNIIGQPTSTLKLKDILDKGQILIVRLPIGQLGVEKASLIANLVLSQLYFAALGRKGHVPYHLYLNSLHRFGSNILVSMLDNVAEHGVTLTMAHRYLAELDEELRDAIFGTVGTIIAFRLGPIDADQIQKLFPLDNNRKALTDLAAHEASIKTPQQTHNELFMPPSDTLEYSRAPTEIRVRSRRHYSAQQKVVENRISRFLGLV